MEACRTTYELESLVKENKIPTITINGNRIFLFNLLVISRILRPRNIANNEKEIDSERIIVSH
jgi:hypothetical protein